MKDFIALAAIFALFALGFYYERKEKKRKEHEDWIHDCRHCLVKITHIFRRDCQSIAEKTFVQYTTIMQNGSYKHTPDHMTYYFLSNYQKEIDVLKEDYIENVIKKLNETMGCTTITSIPNYLIEEYCKQLSDIYYSFCDFAYLMRRQITKANENHINILSKGR